VVNTPGNRKTARREVVLTVEEWAEIRRLYVGEKLSNKAITRRLGVARNTVRVAIRSTSPPKYERSSRCSVVDEVEPQIRALLTEYPRMPATVIAERVEWRRGITVLRDRVAELRPLYLPPEPYQRTEYTAGELAQWDLWFPPVDIPVGAELCARPPVLVGVSGYSRWIVARMIPSRESCDLLGGHLACLKDLGAVPRAGVYDNEGAIGRRRGGRAELTDAFQRFSGALAMRVVLLRPAFPEGKGLVERANGYLETSFLPGRSFAGVGDFNAQLSTWLRLANRRVHRILRCRPTDRIAVDRAAMLPLPTVLPDVAWHSAIRIGRDHYVRFGTCDYSVHPRAIGRRAEVRVDLDAVVVTLDGREVAHHQRCLAPHQTITDPTHEQARRDLQARRELIRTRVDLEVEVRDLSVYDRLVGVA
jgi:transposase